MRRDGWFQAMVRFRVFSFKVETMFVRVGSLSVLMLASLVVGAGCGGKPSGPVTYKIAGTVQFNSAPVEVGEIIIRSQDGKHAAASVITNGKYELKATEGAKIVEVTALRDVPGKFREDNPGEKVPVREQYIPAKYNAKTTLKLTVETNDNLEANFDLAK